jgi:hypothetical protein
MRLEPPQGTTALQPHVQHEGFRMPSEQPIPKFAQHGKIEAWTAQLQPQQVLPINVCADGLPCVAVREVFTKLHAGHQGEAPGRKARLTTRREESRKVLILDNGAEGVPERAIEVPWGKAACATRAVSSGTDWMRWGLSDIADLLVVREMPHTE